MDVSHETERPGMADAPPLSRRYITISEAAEYLAVTDRTVRQMIADGATRIPLRHPPRPSAPR